MERGTRKRPSKTRSAVVKRAWYAAHQEARAQLEGDAVSGESLAVVRTIADNAAARVGAAWTRRKRARWTHEAIQALERAGAAHPARTPSSEQRPRSAPAPSHAHARWLERQRDPRVQARKGDIRARDRARALGQPLPRQLAPPAHVTHEDARRIWRRMMEDLKRAQLEGERETSARRERRRPYRP